MAHTPDAPPEHGWQRILWKLTALASAACLVLGFIAYSSLPEPKQDGFSRFALALYQSVQLLLLHGHAEANGWQFHVAQLLAIAVLSSTVTLTLLKIFRQGARMRWIRWTGRHVVVCGLGQYGLQLVKEFTRGHESPVVIEHHPDNENVSGAEERGALVLVANPASRRILLKAAAHRAKYLIAISEDDGTNVEIAMKASRLIRETRGAAAPSVHCFVHIVDLQLRRLFAQHRLFSAQERQAKINIFNIFENSARMLLAKYPLDPVGIGGSDVRTVHLILFGFGQMGQSVALQAAKMGHYANGKDVRITVIDKAATAKKHSFYHHYPFFSEVCHVQFHDWDAEDLESLQEALKWTSEESSVCTCIICFDNDTRSLSFALKLLKTIPASVPIQVRMRSSGGFGSLLTGSGEAPHLPARLTAFGMISDACTVEMVVGEKLDALAQAIHEDFVQKRKDEQRRGDEDPAMAPWDRLDETFINSNRQQADHIDVKLRAIKCERSQFESGEKTGFSKEEIDLLAKMEHARWNAERRLDGWTYAEGKKNLEAKTSPYIVTWDALPEEVKEYDREAVKNIPRLLRWIRERLHR